MAAGMGSRYGGLKQIDPVGPNGEIIIDYSIYDAINAGFGKLVFVICGYFEDAFREKIGSKFDHLVETAYAFQELDACLGGMEVPGNRQKPWGTGHAILVAQDIIDEPFAVINADDYYGANSFKIMADYLSAAGGADDYSMVGYTLKNTLSEYGHVARGICQCDDEMFLKMVVEHLKVEKAGEGARSFGNLGQEQNLSGNETVSMNFWGFGPSIFGHLKTQFQDFIENNAENPTAEFFIPSVVDNLIQSGQRCVKVLPTEDSWFGVTYRKDKLIAVECINKLISRGIYPQKLWKT